MAATLNNLCNHTFADANATGFFNFSPGINTPGLTNVSWAVTLHQNDTFVTTAFWYNSGGANYSDALGLSYDVCNIGLPNLNEYAQSRASLDDGDCTGATDSTCASDLEALAISAAENLGASPGADANNPNILPTVCQGINKKILAKFPSSCEPYFNTSGPVDFYSAPLTNFGNNASYLYSEPYCTIGKEPYSPTNLNASSDVWWSLGETLYYTSDRVYDVNSFRMYPQMTMFMPLVGQGASSTVRISTTTSKLLCMRPQKFTKDSRVASAPVPMTTSNGTAAVTGHGNKLSGGDIAGIVVGTVVGALLILGIAFWLWRRNRQARRRRLSDDEKPVVSEMGGAHHTTEADSAPIEELGASEKSSAAELEPKLTNSELPVEDDLKHEMDAGTPLHIGELPANEPVRREKKIEEE